MLSRIKKEGYEPLVLSYYEKANGKLVEKDIPDKFVLFSNRDVRNYEMVGYYFKPFHTYLLTLS